MKNFLTLLILGLSTILVAQVDYNTVETEKILAGMQSQGSLFSEPSFTPGLHFKVVPSGDFLVNTVYGSELWVAATMNSGELRTIAPQYAGFSDGITFTPGPYNAEELPYDLNAVSKVTGAEIINHIVDFQDGIIDGNVPSNILEWPGRANQYLGSNFPDQDLAPFYDQNADGKYDPYQGDYPLLFGDQSTFIPLEMIYSVSSSFFTEENRNPDLEIHVIMYTLNCEHELLSRAVFTNHKVIPKSSELSSLLIGTWTDFDLGCPTDDYSGASPENNMYYTYNEDEVDGTTGSLCDAGINSFGEIPPVQASKFLNTPMTSFAQLNRAGIGGFPPGTWAPETVLETYNIATGLWRDGTPITYGGTGYDPLSTDTVKFQFSETPNIAENWAMSNVDYGPSDRVSIAMTSHTNIVENESIIIDMVHLLSRDENLNHLDQVDKSIEEMQEIQALYDENFETTCQLLIANANYSISSDVHLFPNPANNLVTIESEYTFDTYSLINTNGQTLLDGSLTQNQINLAEISSGYYILNLRTKEGTTAIKSLVIGK